MRTPQAYRGGELVLVLDCSNLDTSARFWAEVLGYEPGGPVLGPPGSLYLSLYPPGGAGIELLLQSVPDVKLQKNRLHLDLRTDDLEAEVSRVTAAGARRLTREPVTEEGWRWHVLADPDGNEFCILQGPG
ncbi:MAG TPA: VOC family protein [Streptosporangiaceae bacterium]|jgi:catechol 2,3-dioxygenase-like lactoylglutathione lyase family enzyme